MEHFSKNLETHVDRLVKIMGKIPVKGVSILTGSNGSGKSLIRTQFIFYLARKKKKDPKNMRGVLGSVSMQLRTSSNAEWGALSGAMRDTEWIPTSLNTFDLIKGLLEKDFEYIIIDEPEIGMGEELIMSLCDFLNEAFEKNPNRGFLIITHNRYLIKNLNFKKFYNCDGIKTKEEWLNRPLKKADLKVLEDNALFYHIRDKQKEK
jgi:predicted ATPase